MAIVGETRTILHKETGDVAYTLSDQAIVWTLPDDTEQDPELTVSVDPSGSTSALSHTLATDAPFLSQGIYQALWSFGQGSQTRKRHEYYFAANTDIWGEVRRITGKNLSDETLDDLFVQITRYVDGQYDCVTGGYKDLDTPDALYYEMALAYLAAARYAAFHSEEFASGPKTRVTQGPVTYEYAGGKGTVILTDKQSSWLEEAYKNLSLVSCIADSIAAVNDEVELFALAGARRGIKQYFRYGINQLYPVASTELLAWP